MSHLLLKIKIQNDLKIELLALKSWRFKTIDLICLVLKFYWRGSATYGQPRLIYNI